MKKIIITLLSFLIYTNILLAGIGGGDKDSTKNATTLPPAVNNALDSRSFPSLDNQFNNKNWNNDSVGDDPKMGYAQEAEKKLKKLETWFDKLQQKNKFITDLMQGKKYNMPVGIKKVVGNVTYILGIKKISFTKDYAEFDAFVRVKIPQQNGTGEVKDLYFAGTGLRISNKGGIYGDNVQLRLMADYKLDLGGGKSALVLKGGVDDAEATFVNIDCNGFKSMQINGDVIFPRTMLLPVGIDGEVEKDTKKKVTAHVRTVIEDWNNIMIDRLSFTPFEISGLKGFVFELKNASFDFSDNRNPAGFSFPEQYIQTTKVNTNENLWRGVYVEAFTLKLPKAFEKRNDKDRVGLEVFKLIIDGTGVTAKVAATGKILDIGKGSAGGWGFSVDNVSLDILQNNITGGGVGGAIKIPVDSLSALKYYARISKDEGFSLVVNPADTLQFRLWNTAKVELYKNSSVGLKINAEGKFDAEASLSGRMNLNPVGQGNKDAKFEGVVFQELVLRTKKPYLEIKGKFGYEGNISLGGSVSLNNIILSTPQPDTVAISFGAGVQLTGSPNGTGNGASADMRIKAAYNEQKGYWQYAGFDMTSMCIQLDFGAFNLQGCIKNFGLDIPDPKYGTGYVGNFKLHLTALGNIDIEAKALFGKTTGDQGFKYWYADAFVDLGEFGIPIPPSLKLTGFGGGAYEHMRMVRYGAEPKNAKETTYDNKNIGSTPSGLVYEPDNTVSFGFRASVGIATLQSKLFNAKVHLEIAFASTGGIASIMLMGKGKLLTPALNNLGKAQEGFKWLTKKPTENSVKTEVASEKDKDKTEQESSVTAVVIMKMDFTTKTFDGIFDLSLDAGPLQGNGKMAMHIAPDMWYIYVGTPSRKVQLSFDLKIIKATAGAYFMVGSKIEAPPSIPEYVINGIGAQAGSFNNMRDMDALAKGGGLAFGTDMSLALPEFNYLMFYGNFSMGFGFDIMLRNLQGATCNGKQAGVNGWMASGQAWAFVQGGLGVDTKLTGKVEILNLAAGVVLEAKVPNPIWLKGVIGGSVSALGGLIKGDFHFEFEAGDKCTLQGAVNNDVVMISDITPNNDSKDVNVFATPIARFNIPIGRDIEYADANGNKINTSATLQTFNVTIGNTAVAGKITWNNDFTEATFHPNELLPAGATLNANITVTMNGKTETKTIQFTTGGAPNAIPIGNIQYSYPVINQMNYFKGEYNKGYIQLSQGQQYLFNGADAEVNITTITGSIIVKANYIASTKQLTWDMPTINKQEKYTLDITGLVKEGAVTNRKVLLTYRFNTSAFETFAQKIQTIKALPNRGAQKVKDNIYDVIIIKAAIPPVEAFDIAELTGNIYTNEQPLIKTTAVLQGNSYFETDINPLIYANYPYDGAVHFNRSAVANDIKPVWAVDPWIGIVNNFDGYGGKVEVFPFIYNVPFQYKLDMMDVQTQLARYYHQRQMPIPSKYLTIDTTAALPQTRSGAHKVKLLYILPGGQLGTSGEFEFNNPLRAPQE